MQAVFAIRKGGSKILTTTAQFLTSVVDIPPLDKLVDTADRIYKGHSQRINTLPTKDEHKYDEIHQMKVEMIEVKTLLVCYTLKQETQELLQVQKQRQEELE